MSKVSLRIVRYAFFFGSVLILGACIMPVDVGPLVSGGNTKEPGVIIVLIPPSITDHAPELEVNGTPVSGEGPVTVSDDPMTITVANDTDYSSIAWYFNGALLTDAQGVGSGGITLTITLGVAPFDGTGVSQYLISVDGTTDGVLYSTWFLVNVY